MHALLSKQLNLKIGIDSPIVFVSPQPVNNLCHTCLRAIDIVDHVYGPLQTMSQAHKVVIHIPDHISYRVLILHLPSLGFGENPCRLSPPDPV